MMRSARLGGVAEVNWGNTSVTKRAYVQEGVQAYSASGPDGFVPWYEHDTPGVVVSAIGAQCGKTWYARGQWTPIKNTIWFRSSDPEVDTRYLYYATSDPTIWPRRGAAQPFISKGDAQDLRLTLPPLMNQRTIVAVMSGFDDLIENNRRRIETLEEMARLLYREWFVHFRFPGHEDVELVDSELGRIPEGWTAGQFRDLVLESKKTVAPRRDSRWLANRRAGAPTEAFHDTLRMGSGFRGREVDARPSLKGTFSSGRSGPTSTRL